MEKKHLLSVMEGFLIAQINVTVVTCYKDNDSKCDSNSSTGVHLFPPNVLEKGYNMPQDFL